MTTVVPLDWASTALREGRPLPRRAVALTFDDGYRDNLELALPVLRDLGLPATFYLVPGILEGDVDPWWERLGWAFARARAERVVFEGSALDLGSARARGASLERVEPLLKSRDETARQAAVAELVDALAPAGAYRPADLFMDWDEARVLVAGGAAVGSHTMRHRILAREDAHLQLADLRESRERLQAELRAPVASLAYPNGQRGDYDAATISAASAAGYASAVTTRGLVNRRSTDPLESRRRVLAPGDDVVRVMAGLVRGTLRGCART
jgi:peptidoglycan/xylan/chitin deacetylase (PgdA/CDA1 family)